MSESDIPELSADFTHIEGVGRDTLTGLVHPRTRVGGGARKIRVSRYAGRSRLWEGPERSEAKWSPREGIPSYVLTTKKE